MKLKHSALVSALAGILAAPVVMADDVHKVYGQVNISIDNTSLSGSGFSAEQQDGSSPWVGRDKGTGFKSNASRIGLMGNMATNLGDARLTYVAELEYTTVGDTGANNVFGREATVGLNSKQFGHLRMGRLTPMYKSNYAVIDPWTDHVLQARAGGQQGASSLNANYFNNAIEYRSPNFNGISFSGFYSIMHDGSSQRMHNAGAMGRYIGGTAYGFGVRYLKDGLRLALDTIKLDADSFAPGGVGGVNVDNGSANKLTAEYKTKQYSVAAHYEDASGINQGKNMFAVAGLYAGHSTFTASYGINQGDTNNTFGTKDATTMNLGYKYKLNRRSDIIAGYSIHERDTNAGLARKASTFTVGIDAKFGY
ncbi:porin [Thiomicrospira microaerophila]|uniref:porin n=1 Tax=Thiomicrospira microaerophila TaxID=406020 RepID=UPI00200C3D26|nr:porin [Thiomicrospira microaerophila]UQB43041.1 porin [Thiomicrospira microaerophila]